MSSIPPIEPESEICSGGNASELAQGFARILHTFPRQAIEDLERLLSNDLGAPTSAELREARLGLLLEMIGSGDGEIPSTREYNELRRPGRRRRANIGPPPRPS